ncbi:MAG: hypothetical protein KF718_31565 [Polyangiaceae bacterium]|nr:hypothetical protein [Polyangiaceae bacterium]
MRRALPALLASCLAASPALAETVPATPADYQQKLATLQPGDTLALAGGDYLNGMNLFDLNGAPGSPIVIEGPASGAPARFLAKSGKNTIDIRRASFVTIRNLVLDGQGVPVDAIKAGGQATDWAHHITIEGCRITGHDNSQQTVGISTKIVAWDWIVRGNVIAGAGTGAYFGNSDGTRAFIGGLIEHNLFADTLGYNMQIKYQLHRQQADVPSVPTDDRVAIIRHNVFIKNDKPSPDGARPNVLVDGPPSSGPGSGDRAEIYGNFFFHNPGDALFQGNGRLHIHDNVLVDSAHAAIRLANHDGKTVIDALVYNNTIYATQTGISFGSAPSGASFVRGNAIFSPSPFNATVTGQTDNVTDSVANAGNYVGAPSTVLGQMDFFPKAGGGLKGSAIDLSPVSSGSDHDRDFNGTLKDGTFRGAYHGEGQNPGWSPDSTLKSGGASGGAGSGGQGPGSGGAASGGVAGGGLAGSTSGGATGTGAASSGGGSGGSGAAASSGDDDGGCGCRVSSTRERHPAWLLLGALLLARRRRAAIRSR